jgi:hypothetical protein
MDATYARMLSRIFAARRSKAEIMWAKRALGWTAFAARPLTLRELRYAVRIDLGEKGVIPTQPYKGDIFDLCVQFLSKNTNGYVHEIGTKPSVLEEEYAESTHSMSSKASSEDLNEDFIHPVSHHDAKETSDSLVNDLNSEVQFFHYSVKEFLFPPERRELPSDSGASSSEIQCTTDFRKDERPEKWQKDLCLSCLEYLLFDNFQHFSNETPDMFDNWCFQKAPLLKYTVRSWTYHYDQWRDDEKSLQMHALRLQLPDKLHLKFFLHAYLHYAENQWEHFCSSTAFGYYSHTVSSLSDHIGERQGLERKIYQKLADLRFCSKETICAIMPPLKTLLGSSDLNHDRDPSSNQLILEPDIYELLVLYICVCASLDAFKSFFRDPCIFRHDNNVLFFMSLISGRTDIATFLIKEKPGILESTHATFGTCVAVSARASIYRCSFSGTPASQSTTMVELLCKKGADVNQLHPTNGTSLIAVVDCDFKYTTREGSREGPKAKVAILELLLKKGADVNQTSKKYGTVLKVAWAKVRNERRISRSRQILKVLLKRRAYDAEIWEDVVSYAKKAGWTGDFSHPNTNLDNHHENHAAPATAPVSNGYSSVLSITPEQCELRLRNYLKTEKKKLGPFFKDHELEHYALQASKMHHGLVTNHFFSSEMAAKLIILVMFDLVVLVGKSKASEL